MADLLEVGRIVKAHGIRGEVIVDLVSNLSERLASGAVLQSERGSPIDEAAALASWERRYYGRNVLLLFSAGPGRPMLALHMLAP